MGRACFPASISNVDDDYFRQDNQFRWISFEMYSRLTRIESHALSGSGLRSIFIPSSVEVRGPEAFCKKGRGQPTPTEDANISERLRRLRLQDPKF
jgi:hypothetical protein